MKHLCSKYPAEADASCAQCKEISEIRDRWDADYLRLVELVKPKDIEEEALLEDIELNPHIYREEITNSDRWLLELMIEERELNEGEEDD